MAISGMYPHVMHGESLSIIYPAFSKFTYDHAVPQFATIGRIFNPELNGVSDQIAAERSCEEIDKFIKSVGMWMSLKDANMPEDEIEDLSKASMVLPDYQGNPRVATPDEMLDLIKESYYS
jgi:alcohol dehydrogenase class IV